MEQILTTFREQEKNADRKNMLEVCIGECRRLRDLIRSMQSFGRPTTSHKCPTDLNTIINDVLYLCAKIFEKNNIHIEKKLQSVPRVDAVEDQMKQVLFNLITNACDAVPQEGAGSWFQPCGRLGMSFWRWRIMAVVLAPTICRPSLPLFYHQAGGSGHRSRLVHLLWYCHQS